MRIESPGEYLFLYGSLLTGTGDRRVDARLRRALRPYSAAYIQARLYDLGAYPAAVVSAAARDRVNGMVFRLRRPEFLRSLDRYELYHPDAPRHSEYLRCLTSVTLLPNRRSFTCWVYFYNGTVTRRPRIRRGDYAAYLRARRRPEQLERKSIFVAPWKGGEMFLLLSPHLTRRDAQRAGWCGLAFKANHPVRCAAT
jgi:gamma-glutamylcyclotransferase (GGCT)/AIG2-like uncharacterized protein YtfP